MNSSISKLFEQISSFKSAPNFLQKLFFLGCIFFSTQSAFVYASPGKTKAEIASDRIEPRSPERLQWQSTSFAELLQSHSESQQLHSKYKLGSIREFRQFPALNATESPLWEYSLEEMVPRSDTLEKLKQEALDMIQKAVEGGNLKDYLMPEHLVELPIGIEKTIAGITYTLVLHKAEFFEGYASVDAYLQFKIPQKDEPLLFMARGVRFTFAGGIMDGRLDLIGDYPLNMLGERIRMIVKGANRDFSNPGNTAFTYASFDCSGFTELNLAADVLFSKEFVKEDNNGNTTADSLLKVSIAANMMGWNDVILRMDIPRFHISKAPNVSYEVQEAYLDLSDGRNPNGIIFPQDYQSPFFQEGLRELWRGVYIRTAKIYLPSFVKSENGNRLTIVGENMIIDNMGFSGAVGADNILDLRQGKADTWAISLDRFRLNMVANTIQSAELSGKIMVPIFEADKPMAYSGAMLENGKYALSATLASNVKIPLWAADANILPNSRIDLRIENNEIIPTAVLHGTLAISANIGGANEDPNDATKKAVLPGIQFSGLEISSRAPKLKVATISMGTSNNGSPKLSGFPLQISKIGLETDPLDELMSGLKFDVTLSLSPGDKGAGVGASGTFVIWAKEVSEGGLLSYRYDRLQVNRLAVNVQKSDAFSFQGEVEFIRGDAIYGNGFRGSVAAKFSGISVDAIALFGNVNDMRYWFVDAQAVFKTGITIAPGLAAYGFSGGAYYRMQQSTEGTASNRIGASLSGIKYVPSETVFLGIKAGVFLGSAGKPEALNGDASFEISFQNTGAIERVQFRGNVYFMTKEFIAETQKLKKNQEQSVLGAEIPKNQGAESAVFGSIVMTFDNVNKNFHGLVQVYIDMPGGVIKGTGAGNLAAQAELYFGQDKWYVHVGSPTTPAGVKIAGFIQANAYFMMGHDLPGGFPPPANVERILNGRDLSMNRSLGDLQGGRGIAFGANFSVNTGDLRFLIFYGSFQAGAGFDLMMVDYGNTSCEGRTGPIGVNGWFAQGQAYAYLAGEIGMRVNLRFVKKDVKILSIGAAAVMQASGPNPFWMRGVVGGQYNILNGLVKGSCSFEVEIGEQCEVQREVNPMDNIQVIASLNPGNNEQEVDVFTNPRVVFNMPVGQAFTLSEEDGKRMSYQVVIKELLLLDKGKPLAAEQLWSDDRKVVALKPLDILPGQTELTFKVRIEFQEKEGYGTWQDVKYNGANVFEQQEVKFTTGVEPDYIPLHTIAVSYPTIGMVNFHPKEYGKAFVVLNQGRPNLFAPDPDWRMKAHFVNANGTVVETAFKYTNAEKILEFDVPQNLQLDQVMAFRLFNEPTAPKASLDAGVEKIIQTVDFGTDNNTEITTFQSEESIQNREEKDVLVYYFRTSRYATFREKMEDSNVNTINAEWGLRPGVLELISRLEHKENFGFDELNGLNNYPPFIQLQAISDSNPWLGSDMIPLLYSGYPIDGIGVISKRNTQDLGVIPLKAIYFRQSNRNQKIDEGFFSTGRFIRIDNSFEVIYNLSLVTQNDFLEIATKLADAKDRGRTLSSQGNRVLAVGAYKMIYGSKFGYSISYTIPHINLTTYQGQRLINR